MDTTHQSARYYDSKLKDGSPVHTRQGSPPIDSSANAPDHVTNALAFLKDVEKISKRAPDIIQELNTLSKVLSDRTIFRPCPNTAQNPRELDLEKIVKRLTEEKDSLQKRLNDACTHTDQKNELTEQERQNRRREELQNAKEERDNLQKKLDKINKEKTKLETDLAECKNRLSKQIGDKITEGNPDIADLSDKNRPTKLGEQYMELYDNQWTEAFEELDKEKPNMETEHIRTLLDLLKDIMGFCVRQSKDQTEMVTCAIQMKEKWASVNPLPESANRIVKALKKETAEILLGELEKKYFSYSGQRYNQLSHRNPPKPALKSFISACIRLCWLMCIQDPPVVLDQTTVFYNSPFNQDRYKPYTKKGSRVEFLVWPALLLHENGPVLAKGVAQGLGEPLFKAIKVDVSGKIVHETTTRPECTHTTVVSDPNLHSKGNEDRLYESRHGQHVDQYYTTHSTKRNNNNPTSVMRLSPQTPYAAGRANGNVERKRSVGPLKDLDNLVDRLFEIGKNPIPEKQTTLQHNQSSEVAESASRDTYANRSNKGVYNI